MENKAVIRSISHAVVAGEKPLFKHLAGVIAAMIDDGRLTEGCKLPPYRVLSHALNVSPGTVTRAYRELERQRLVEARMGDGNYVLGFAPESKPGFGVAPAEPVARESNLAFVDLSRTQSLLRPEDLPGWKKQADFSATDDVHFGNLLAYGGEAGLEAHRRAGAEWLRHYGARIHPGNVFCTNGSQHGIHLALAAVMQPHDALGVDEYTYPGLLSLARRFNLRIVAIKHDRNGLCPDDLAEKSRHHRITAVFTTPNMQNPMGYEMPDARRDALAEICAEKRLYILEDETQGRLSGRSFRTFYERLPGQTVLIAGVSKVMASGLRVGYLAIPPNMHDRFKSIMRDHCWMATPISHEIAKRCMESGFAEICRKRMMAEIARRKAIIAPALEGLEYASAEYSAHFWIALPYTMTDLEAAEALREKNIAIAPSSQFSSRSRQARCYIRASVTTHADDRNLMRAFAEIGNLLRK